MLSGAGLRKQYELVPYGLNGTEIDWGRLLPNGTWTGVLGESDAQSELTVAYALSVDDIRSGIIDTFAATYSATSERLDYFTFTFPVAYEQFMLVGRQHEKSMWKSALLFWKVFSPQLWLAYLATFVAVAATTLAVRLVANDDAFAQLVARRRRTRRSSTMARVSALASELARQLWYQFMIVMQVRAIRISHPAPDSGISYIR